MAFGSISSSGEVSVGSFSVDWDSESFDDCVPVFSFTTEEGAHPKLFNSKAKQMKMKMSKRYLFKMGSRSFDFF